MVTHPEVLDRVVVVLWQPQDRVNVAGTVRALKNFGLARLRLVAPAEWDPWRIEGIAHDTHDIVAATRIYETLEEALADCSYVAALTARERRAKRALARPREIAPEILARASEPEGGPVALLFGREDHGLPNAALDLAHRTVIIPTNPSHRSLNLAQAVLVMAYELWLAASGGGQAFRGPRRKAPPASVELLERCFADVETALRSIDFFKSRQPRTALSTLREVAHRADLDEREAGLLRAIALEVGHYLGRLDSGDGSA